MYAGGILCKDVYSFTLFDTIEQNDAFLEVDDHITWSQKRKQQSVSKVASHVEWIIDWKKDQDIPDKPQMEVPQRKTYASLGTRTLEAEELYELFEKKTASIRGEVEHWAVEKDKRREGRGERGSIYTVMQPTVRPTLQELLEKSIDILYPFEVDPEMNGERRQCCGGVKG